MPKLPTLPDRQRLEEIGPDIHTPAQDQVYWRVYLRGGPHPSAWDGFRKFGPLTTARFDHHREDGIPAIGGAAPPLGPSMQDRGICYLAAEGPTCLAEVFQATRLIERRYREPWITAFRLKSPPKLLDLTGSWPTRAGASAAISSGRRNAARNWSRACYEIYPEIEGIAYGSSMAANRPCYALFERAKNLLPARPGTDRALADPKLDIMLINAAEDLGYGIAYEPKARA